jgi:peroxiredoxin
MRSRLSPAAIIALVLLAGFTVFITWRAKKLEAALRDRVDQPELINKAAPSFELEALDGQKVALADYHGRKKLVLSFWASWCGPCKAEMPTLRQFYQSHRKDADKFELLAISIDDEQRDAERFATEMKLPFPVLWDAKGLAREAYSVDAIPALFIINESGKVTYAHVGFDAALQFALAQQLGFKPTPTDGGADDGHAGN